MSDRPAYLLMLAPGAERLRFSDYVAGLPSLYAEYGGQHLAVAPAPTVERFGHDGAAQSVMLSRWPSRERLLEFWRSPAHQRLARRRDVDGSMRVAVFEGEPSADVPPHAEAIALFLGPGPTRALLEAEGARTLALVRERQVEAVAAPWSLGDIAIYAWDSARQARRQLVAFSSGQRGGAMLLPTLLPSRTLPAVEPYAPQQISAVA